MNAFLKAAVRTRLALTSAERGIRDAEGETAKTLALVEAAGAVEAAAPRQSPALLGVDEDMRHWSLFQILEHNAIVTRRLTKVVAALGSGETLQSDFDPKTDVMPSAGAGAEQIENFRTSTREHVSTVRALGSLKSNLKHPHPVFGPLDAHQFHCFVGFHLRIHRRQVEAVLK